MKKLALLILCFYALKANTQINFDEVDKVIDHNNAQKYDWAFNYLDSLENVATLEDKQKIYSKRACILINQKKFKEADVEIEDGLALCNNSTCYPSKSNLDFQRARWYFQQNNLPKATEIILKNNYSLEKYAPNSSALASSYSLAAYYFNLLGKDDEAEEMLLNAAKILKQINPEKNISNIYNNLGIISKKQKKYEKALDYYKISIEEDKKHGETFYISQSLNNIASLFVAMNELDSSKYYLMKAKEFETDKNVMKSSADINLLQFYNSRNELDAASRIATNLLRDIDEDDLTPSQKNTLYGQLSILYQKLNQNDQALFYLRKQQNAQQLLFDFETEKIKNEAETKARIRYQKEVIEALEEKNYFQSLSIQQKEELQKETASKLSFQDQVINALEERNYFQSLSIQQKEELQKETASKLSYQEEVINTLKDKNYYQSLSLKQQKALFTVLFVLSALIIGTGVVLYKQNILRNQKKQLELEQQVLRSQMNPHFIFNALTAIQNMVIEQDAMKSASAIAKFSKLIRQNFEFIKKEQISLADDIDALENYIKTQQMRFPDLFDYEIIVDQSVDLQTDKVPPMLLQPFVENAIEHGLKHKKEKGKLSISVIKEKDSLSFEITDNGQGYYPKKDDKLHAIDVIKARLNLLKKGADKTFKIKNLAQGGTSVYFTI